MNETNEHMFFSGQLMSRMPEVRGTLTPHAPLKDSTWFRVGGPAEILFKPADTQDLAAFLSALPADIPVTVLGVASNTLIRDGGLAGVVIRLGPTFSKIECVAEKVTAGAAAMDVNVSRAAAKVGLGGLEFLSGIPGTIGGALRMNAGAYGGEIKDVLQTATCVTRTGKIQTISLVDMNYGYRHSDAPKDWIYVSATFNAHKDDTAAIESRMRVIMESRAESQPIRERTGGSTFANPDGHKAWRLIDEAGCRGLCIGGAKMSEQHCNFIINTGDATAHDIERLGKEVQKRVRETSGIELRFEIKIIGISLDEGERQ